MSDEQVTRARHALPTAPQMPVRTDTSEVIARLWRDGLRVGRWRVEPRRHLLVRGGTERRLDPRLMHLLLTLAAQPGDVVTRRELLDSVWHDVIVTENSLSKAVSRLRRALRDEESGHEDIETISKSGYRLVAPVETSPAVAALESRPVPSRAGQPERRRLGIAAIVLLSVAGVLALGGRSVPEPEPGARIRPELTLVGNQFGPRLSPDGTHVAFAWQAEGASSWDVWMQAIGADQPEQLTDHAHHERLPTWSADGSRLVFVRFADSGGDDRSEPDCGIFALRIDDRSEERLADCLRGMRSLAWSPDGRWLAHNGAVGENTDTVALYLVDLEAGTRRRLTRPPADIPGDTSVRFSPDGTRLAFEREVGTHRHDVAVVEIGGGDVRMLTSDAWGQVRGVDWTADGKAIVFSSNRTGGYALWRVAVEGGAPVRVPIHDAWVTQPSVARTGGRLVYRTFRDAVDVWEVALVDGERVDGTPTRRVASSRSERQPVWSPEGDRIAFVSDRGGTTELWSGRPDGTELIRHTSFLGPRPGSPAWSPDGRHIVFDAALDGHADLWIVERTSRRPRRLTDLPTEERNAGFSRDGESLYFASDRGGGWNLWRMPANGGVAETVTTEGGFLARESVDGETLFYARLDRPGIWSTPVGGGASTLVVDDLDLSDWGTWDVGARGIYYLRRRPTALWLAPLDGSAPRLVDSPPRQVPYLGRALSLSPDGRSLLLAQIAYSDDEVMTVDMAGL